MAILVIFGAGSPARLLEGLGETPHDRAVRIWPDVGDPEQIEFVIAWKPPVGSIAQLPRLKAIFSFGAGVDALLDDTTLPPDVPVVRFVDPDLTQRMTEYVALHTLFHHRRMGEYLAQQARHTWSSFGEPLASDVGVGLMGIGVLGSACANKLKMIGYDVAAWSRSTKANIGIPCFCGEAELDAFLARTDILVSLLPLTPRTRGILDRKLIGKLRRGGRFAGPVLINPGRGGLQVGADILAALDAGELRAASLDVFETEPLPADSPIWRHPRIVVTPHNASDSDGRNVARYVLHQIKAFEAGKPLENVVDRRQGY